MELLFILISGLLIQFAIAGKPILRTSNDDVEDYSELQTAQEQADMVDPFETYSHQNNYDDDRDRYSSKSRGKYSPKSHERYEKSYEKHSSKNRERYSPKGYKKHSLSRDIYNAQSHESSSQEHTLDFNRENNKRNRNRDQFIEPNLLAVIVLNGNSAGSPRGGLKLANKTPLSTNDFQKYVRDPLNNKEILRWKGCSKKAAKQCQKACKAAIKSACRDYVCKSGMKKAFKKACKRCCRDKFMD